MTTASVDQFKDGQRTIWGSGAYPEIAERIQVASDELIEDAGLEPGTTVLDIATGSGNLAVPAALKGAQVTGLDLVPELLEAAARRADEAGVEVDWVEGDAEALPFEDDSFDRALSTFGVMFAPRHDVAAREMVRVCKPGGLIGTCAWTPQGGVGEMFKLVSGYMPPPPDFVQPPPLWGNEDHLRSLLADSCDLEFEHRVVVFEDETPEAYYEWFLPRFGPLVVAKQALPPERFEELTQELLAMSRRQNSSPDAYRVEAEYLRVLARVR